MSKPTLTAERLRELLHYDPGTGAFTRKVDVKLRGERVAASKGDAAGYLTDGYLLCRLDGRIYKCHRLAWLYVHGEWPKQQIDHINGVRNDNRIANLRDVSHQLNMQNIKTSRGASGVLGVNKNGRSGWQAKITVENKPLSLGTYRTPEAAHAAYLEAKRRLHPGNTL
jgi:hypothetical protein